jgi:hypothetical protein
MKIRITNGANISEPDVRFDIRTQSGRYDLYFRSNHGILAGHTEAAFACGLLPAMRKASAIVVDGRASRKMLGALSRIQDIYSVWDPSLHKVSIEGALPDENARTSGARVGTFFSGGVDSFYTFLKHRNEISDLIFVHGFDIPLEDETLRARASEAIRAAAANYGKRVVEVETNLKSFL